MKQYRIVFYYESTTEHPSAYYREFETITELEEWANDMLKDCSWFIKYRYFTISSNTFLINTQNQ